MTNPAPENVTVGELADDGTITIGSGADCTVHVKGDRYVSKLHARILKGDEPGEVFIEDAGSTNGTLVNGKRIGLGRRVRLHPGDRVRVGRTDLG